MQNKMWKTGAIHIGGDVTEEKVCKYLTFAGCQADEKTTITKYCLLCQMNSALIHAKVGDSFLLAADLVVLHEIITREIEPKDMNIINSIGKSLKKIPLQ
jgi:hypothetical protein